MPRKKTTSQARVVTKGSQESSRTAATDAGDHSDSAETGHTPGPWMVEQRTTDGEIEAWVRLSNACTLAYFGSSITLGIGLANARLIAAAPDLLDALKALTTKSPNGTQLCFRTKNSIPMGMSRAQEKLARAALAKAEGKG